MSTDDKHLEAILADPEAFGFKWSSETVKQDGVPFPAEIPVPNDVPKFDTIRPGLVLEFIRGSSSVRVLTQSVGRNARGKLKQAALRRRVIEALLGIDLPQTVVKYKVRIDGEWMEFDSQEEAEAAELELATP